MPDQPAQLWYPEPPLTDGVVVLRRWSRGDVGCVEEATRDPDIPRGTTVPARFTPSEGLAWIERQWSPRARGHGIGSRAVGLLACWAVTEATPARVEALVVPDNIASQRVLEKVGFQREGQLRSYLVVEDQRADAVMYSLLPSDLS